MGRLRKLADKAKFISSQAYSISPAKGVTRPVFILGCGRSGTTIFGSSLSKHPEVTFLNEPRGLWQIAYPQTDIWSDQAAARNGKLVLTAADATKLASYRLRRLFRFETFITGRPLLIEKLPINSFRLSLINNIFPDARYLHIHRNGIDVAKSIEASNEVGQWYGSNSYKWGQLAQYASLNDETRALLELCSDYFHMGLLEWRLSTEAIVDFSHSLPSERFFEVSYEQLVGDPSATIERVLAFLNIDCDLCVLAFARSVVRRRKRSHSSRELSALESQIGGRLLPASLTGIIGLSTL